MSIIVIFQISRIKDNLKLVVYPTVYLNKMRTFMYLVFIGNLFESIITALLKQHFVGFEKTARSC